MTKKSAAVPLLPIYDYSEIFFTDSSDEKFFSVLKTLAAAFQGGDPCQEIQKYSGGLKNFCRGDVVLVIYCQQISLV